jgi:hypothetical protein
LAPDVAIAKEIASAGRFRLCSYGASALAKARGWEEILVPLGEAGARKPVRADCEQEENVA